MTFAVLDHLERQLASARRLLQIVLAQGEAIREQDVETVLARLGDVQAEMVKRVQLERERDDLLAGRPPRWRCDPTTSPWTRCWR
jgi:hypothetical protein